jgi:N-acetylated-alpha-linked acidic dipeptidase
LLDNQRTETEAENKLVRDNLFNIAKDPKKTYAAPVAKDPVPYLSFSELDNMLMQLKSLGEEYQKLYNTAAQLPVNKQNELNEILYKAEQSLIYENGLPRRPWYKHEIYAPGFYTGYGVKTLPAIREGIEQRNYKEAQEGINTVAQAIRAYNKQVQQAIKILGAPTF